MYAQLAPRWAAEVTGTVAAHGAALAAALKAGEPGNEAVQALLRTMLLGILQRSVAASAPQLAQWTVREAQAYAGEDELAPGVQDVAPGQADHGATPAMRSTTCTRLLVVRAFSL